MKRYRPGATIDSYPLSRGGRNRHVNTLARRIADGRYDLVVMTRQVGHSEDGVVRRACRQAAVPLVPIDALVEEAATR